MEDLPAALAAMPDFAAGIVVGALVGVAFGLYQDRRAHDGVPHRWWQFGGLGMAVGAVVWLALIELS